MAVACDKCGGPTIRQADARFFLAGKPVEHAGGYMTADLCRECFRQLTDVVWQWLNHKEHPNG